MTRPFKHPRTGVYWLRRRVPKDLVSVVGRQEVTKSLETRDPVEAKRRLVQALAELDAKWENLKSQPRWLTERMAHAYAMPVYEAWLDQNRDDPSFDETWTTGLYHRLWTDVGIDAEGHLVKDVPAGSMNSQTCNSEKVWLATMIRHSEKEARKLLAKHGIVQSGPNLWAMAKAVAAAMQRASLILEKEAQGIYDAGVGPPVPLPPAGQNRGVRGEAVQNETSRIRHAASSNSVSLTGLVNAWWAEAKTTGRKPSTYESYSNTFANFCRFLKHDDAARVTADDVLRFKDFRLQTPSDKTGRVASAKTVKGTDLSALKTVFGWAVSNRRLASNPASDVTVKVGKPVRIRSKGFSDFEANAILTAALAYRSDRATPQTTAGKKWIPWLCALTGARVGEMAQLRKQDVYLKDGHWVARITPEAGTVKNNQFREVVLHRQLVALGFPAFVEGAADGPLFVRPAKGGDVLGPLQGLKNRLADFSRAIVPDPNVAPMHGFRHRFKTVGRDVGIDGRVLDAIQGHGARTVADAYGDVNLTAIAAAIAKFPDMAAGLDSSQRPDNEPIQGA